MLTAGQLRKKLGLSPKRLERLVKQGLPGKGKGAKRQFDPHAVAAWLRERGLARTAGGKADQIATTIAEAARLVGISSRVFATWLTDPTFPGKAGAPGRQDGYFPIQAIRDWHVATHGARATGGNADEQLLATRKLKAQIDADRAQVEMERELGTIADTEAMASLCRRIVASAKAQLEDLPDRVNARLPAKTQPSLKKIIRKVIAESVIESLNTIAELVAGDQDETEDLPDDESVTDDSADR